MSKFEDLPQQKKTLIANFDNKLVITDTFPKHIASASNIDDLGNASADIEQNKLFDWVRQERLPLFFRTDIFRDFKLCKLLARSLNEYTLDFNASNASSQLIGGYSRQSRNIFLLLKAL